MPTDEDHTQWTASACRVVNTCSARLTSATVTTATNTGNTFFLENSSYRPCTAIIWLTVTGTRVGPLAAEQHHRIQLDPICQFSFVLSCIRQGVLPTLQMAPSAEIMTLPLDRARPPKDSDVSNGRTFCTPAAAAAAADVTPGFP
jgi:hypothetical protein